MNARNCFLIVGCSISMCLFIGIAPTLYAHNVKYGPLSAADVRDARESISIGSSRLLLTASVWRNFMPMGVDSEASKAVVAAARGVMASVQLIDEGGTPLPKYLHAEVVYVVQGESTWQTEEIEERRDESNLSKLNFIVRKGPLWQVGSFVDVVVRLRDGKSAPLLLVLRHQIINAVA